jgi:hypothetical protein
LEADILVCVGDSSETYCFAVGRLLEIRLPPFRTVDDVVKTQGLFGLQIARLPPEEKFSIAADWRAVQIMPPDTAARAREMLAAANQRITRSAILTLPANPTTNLQVVRLVREAQSPNRRHFTDTLAMHHWLSEVLTPEESARLREFLQLT